MTSDPERGELAFEAFAALTEAVGTETDLRVLALRAVNVVKSFLPEASVAYNELEDGRWKARVLSDNVDPALAAEVMGARIAFETPSFLQAVRASRKGFLSLPLTARERFTRTFRPVTWWRC